MNLVLEKATVNDCDCLACLNKMLIDDGGSINSMNIDKLKTRMKQFLLSTYLAYFFVVDGIRIGYALINIEQPPFFIRHFYVINEYRRKGYGTEAFKQITKVLKTTDIDLKVLVQNEIGYKFWISCGLIPYDVTMHYRENR